MAKLIVNPTSAARREIQLPHAIYSIGRDPGNDLVLPDAMVSRRHAVIEPRGKGLYFRDCSSSNGSLVNGELISEQALKDGDLLAIGTTRLLFRAEVEPAEMGPKILQHPSAAHLACRACGAEHGVGDQFCRRCGARIVTDVAAQVTCPACASVVSLPARFCNICGAVLKAEDPSLLTTEPRPVQDPEPILRSPAVASSVPALPPAASVAAGPNTPEAPAPLPSGAAEQPLTPIATVKAQDAPPAPRPPVAFARPSAARPAPARVDNAPRPLRLARRSEPAGSGLRLVAALIDGAVVSTVQLVLLSPVIYYWATREVPTQVSEISYLPILLSFLLLGAALLVGMLYYVYFWGISGATPGKKAMSLVIEDRAGQSPIGIPVAFLRLLGYLISSLPLGAGFLMILFTGYGLHDRLAGTRVVHREDA